MNVEENILRKILIIYEKDMFSLLFYINNQGLYLLSGRTSYRKISWSLKAARFGFRLFQ